MAKRDTPVAPPDQTASRLWAAFDALAAVQLQEAREGREGRDGDGTGRVFVFGQVLRERMALSEADRDAADAVAEVGVNGRPADVTGLGGRPADAAGHDGRPAEAPGHDQAHTFERTDTLERADMVQTDTGVDETQMQHTALADAEIVLLDPHGDDGGDAGEHPQYSLDPDSDAEGEDAKEAEAALTLSHDSAVHVVSAASSPERRPPALKQPPSPDAKRQRVNDSDDDGGGSSTGPVVAVLVILNSKKQKQLFAEHILAAGGQLRETVTPEVTHVVTDLAGDKLLARLKPPLATLPLPPQTRVVSVQWVSDSIKHKAFVDDGPYRLPVAVWSTSPTNSPGRVAGRAADKSDDGAVLYAFLMHTPRTSRKRERLERTSSNVYYDADSGDEVEEGDAAAPAAVGAPVDMTSYEDLDFQPDEYENAELGGNDDNDEVDVLDDDTAARLQQENEAKKETERPRGRWACAQKPDDGQGTHLNERIVWMLDSLSKMYGSMKGDENKWRAYQYRKAAQSVKSYPRRIKSRSEAHLIDYIGPKMADKIGELLDTGTVSKLRMFTDSEFHRTILRFTEIWGVGPTVAENLFNRGYRTIEELRNPLHPATLKHGQPLTRNQQIGLAFLDEFKQRIPRAEVAEIERRVRAAVEEIKPGAKAVATGSYRRRKETCGDVDMVITHPDGASHAGLLQSLIKKLSASGLLTHHLVQSTENHKYHGVCQLDGGLHRRIDFLIVPIREWPFALLHFTGNDYFNRSIRALAGAKGMHLSDKGLWTNVRRVKGERVNEGVRLPGIRTERDIFAALDIPYRHPHERNV